MGYSDTSIGFLGGSTNPETINYKGVNTTNPWKKLSRALYPKTVQGMHAWAAELWLHCGIYSEGISRAVRYFLTDIDLKSAGEEELTYKDKEEYKDTLTGSFDLMKVGEQMASEYVAFGTAACSVYFPFDRLMTCEKCGFHTSLDALREESESEKGVDEAVKFSKESGFHGTCPSCGANVTYKVEDVIRKSDDQKPYVIRWPLKYSEFKRNPISGRMFLQVRLDEWRFLADPVHQGDMDIITELPMDLLEALQTSKALTIQQDEFYVMRFPAHTDVDVELNGYGVPAFMSDFELAFLLVVMFKYMEAMSVDMVSPWRVLTPALAGRAGQKGDPMLNINMGDFMQQVRAMINKHRDNPTLVSTMAYPLEETLIGGDVEKLIPVEWYRYLGELMLQNMGIPYEFSQHSLAGNAAPMIGYALFERDWQHLTNELNGLFTWIGRKVGERKGWKGFSVQLVKSSTHNDPETRQVKMQLASAGQLPWSTAFRAYNLDYKEERMKAIEEAQWETEMQELISRLIENGDVNKQFLRTPSPAERFMLAQQLGQGGGMPVQGGAPPQGGMAPPAQPTTGGTLTGTNTLDAHMAEAEQLAQQLMGMDHADRRGMLANLESQNPSLYAITKMFLQDYEQQAKQQGVELAREEAAMMNQQTP